MTSLSRGVKFYLKFRRDWSIERITEYYKVGSGVVSASISLQIKPPHKDEVRVKPLFCGVHYMELSIEDLRDELTEEEWSRYATRDT